ncbi:MAG: serine/threonine-protein kinase [Myxococcota bacterium]
MADQRFQTPSDPSLPSLPSLADLSGVQRLPTDVPRFDEDRYEELGILGEGGMGEVRLCHDTHVGRDVAMKMLLPNRLGHDAVRSRFLREALIQAQLEHPSIVPVYEVGQSPAGVPTFTMKRIRGRTLETVLDRRREGDPELDRRFGRARLLGAFAQVCLAVDFAHSRGVVHRDLKPANVMLGDFGEVYVLDWGVARVRDEREVPFPLTNVPEVKLTTSVLGTPGYLAPEQIRAPGEVDGRTDVYALGCILFEILTLRVLHCGDSPERVLLGAFRPHAVSSRLDELGAALPEPLVRMLHRATASNPENRFATARQLHDAVQAYLDVDRDREREQQQADALAARGLAHASRARAGTTHAAEHHRTAIRRLGRALALAPGHPIAARGLADLLIDPPPAVPDDAGHSHAEAQNDRVRTAFATLGRARLSWLFYVPLLLWMGLHAPVLVAGCLALALGAGGLDLVVARLPSPRPWLRHGAAALTLLTIMPLGFLFGPFLVAPLVVAASMPALVVQADRTGRHVVLATALVTVFGPIALEWADLVPPALAFSDGTMTQLPGAVAFPELPTRVLLTAVVLGALATSVAMLGRLRDALVEAEDRLHRRAWQLRQLVPGRTGRYLGHPDV